MARVADVDTALAEAQVVCGVVPYERGCLGDRGELHDGLVLCLEHHKLLHRAKLLCHLHHLCLCDVARHVPQVHHPHRLQVSHLLLVVLLCFFFFSFSSLSHSLSHTLALCQRFASFPLLFSLFAVRSFNRFVVALFDFFSELLDRWFHFGSHGLDNLALTAPSGTSGG